MGRFFEDMPMGTFVLGNPAETAGPAHKVALRYSSSLPFIVQLSFMNGVVVVLKSRSN